MPSAIHRRQRAVVGGLAPQSADDLVAADVVVLKHATSQALERAAATEEAAKEMEARRSGARAAFGS